MFCVLYFFLTIIIQAATVGGMIGGAVATITGTSVATGTAIGTVVGAGTGAVIAASEEELCRYGQEKQASGTEF